MGMKLFVKDGIFWPAENGVYPGDVVNVVLVAGGCRGGGTVPGSDLGGDSSFGAYAVAFSGKGAPGAASFTHSTNPYGGGGGGGFIPGSPWQGGPGRPGTSTAGYLPMSNAGGAGALLGANGCSFGGGSKGTGLNSGEGGGGYGAGGGSAGHTSTQYYAGNAGQILYYSHIVTEADMLNGIPITLGIGASVLDATVKTFSATNRTGLIGIKNMVGPIVTAGMWDSSYAVQKTFETANGTYGLTKGSTIHPGTSTWVKFIGVDKVYTFAAAFPGFNNGCDFPIFSCNGYYLQAYMNGSTQLVVKYILIADAHTGQAAAAGTKTYEVTNGAHAGVIGDDLVYAATTTQLTVYQNWTPTASDPLTVTLANNLTTAVSNGSYFLIPVGDKLYQVNVSGGSSTWGTSRTVITNHLTGTTSLVSHNVQVNYVQGSTGYVMCYHYASSTYWYRQQHITDSAMSATGSYSLYFWLGQALVIGSMGRGYGYGGWPIVPCVGDHIGYVSNGGDMSKSYTIAGYDNSAGQSGEGGGAGGCCMISW